MFISKLRELQEFRFGELRASVKLADGVLTFVECAPMEQRKLR